MLIGVVGTAVSGKSTAAEILEGEGFQRISLSEILREKLRERKIDINEEAMYAMGNELRTKFGPAAIIREALNHAAGDAVFDGIHGMAELEWLQDRGAVILGIDADPQTRYEWAIKRVEDGRHENYGRLQDFLAAEVHATDRDRFRCSPAELLEHADIVIRNSGTAEDLRARLSEWLAGLDGRSSGNG